MTDIEDHGDYFRQREANEVAFRKILKVANPNLNALFEILEQTKINWFVVAKIIRQLNNVARGTGYGTVTVIIEKGNVIFVNGEDKDRLMEPLIVEDSLAEKQ